MIPNPRYIILTFFISLLSIMGKSQTFQIKSHLGAMYYQGDLAPKPIDLSFGPGNLSWGLSAGINITDWASINVRYMVGRLSGDDAFADDPGRRLRNLSFSSPLYEYGIYTNLKINKIWKGLDKYKLRLYITAGINYIYFDPQAWYDGRWVRLQPLGTEGQTLKESGKKHYKLYNWSRPLGLILEFDFTKRLALGLEFSPRKTYTDYLDDVSGNYVNADELLSEGNVLGAALSNRMGEYLGTDPVKVATGTPRGRSDKNDWYTYIGVYFKYTLGKINYPKVHHLPDDSMSREEKEANAIPFF